MTPALMLLLLNAYCAPAPGAQASPSIGAANPEDVPSGFPYGLEFITFLNSHPQSGSSSGGSFGAITDKYLSDVFNISTFAYEGLMGVPTPGMGAPYHGSAGGFVFWTDPSGAANQALMATPRVFAPYQGPPGTTGPVFGFSANAPWSKIAGRSVVDAELKGQNPGLPPLSLRLASMSPGEQGDWQIFVTIDKRSPTGFPVGYVDAPVELGDPGVDDVDPAVGSGTIAWAQFVPEMNDFVIRFATIDPYTGILSESQAVKAANIAGRHPSISAHGSTIVFEGRSSSNPDKTEIQFIRTDIPFNHPPPSPPPCDPPEEACGGPQLSFGTIIGDNACTNPRRPRAGESGEQDDSHFDGAILVSAYCESNKFSVATIPSGSPPRSFNVLDVSLPKFISEEEQTPYDANNNVRDLDLLAYTTYYAHAPVGTDRLDLCIGSFAP